MQDHRRISPLKAWLCEHAKNSSLERFTKWKEAGMKDPLIFSSETPMRKFVAYIDPENKFAIEDKLSQINTLEQRELTRAHIIALHDANRTSNFSFERGFVWISEKAPGNT